MSKMYLLLVGFLLQSVNLNTNDVTCTYITKIKDSLNINFHPPLIKNPNTALNILPIKVFTHSKSSLNISDFKSQTC